MGFKLKKPLVILLIISMIFTMLSSQQVVLAKQKTSAEINRGQVCQYVNELLGATKKSKVMKDVTNYKKGDAYYNTMSIAENAGYISINSDNEIVKASSKATYNFVAEVFSKILGISKNKILGKHKSSGTMTLKQFERFTKETVPNVISKNVSNKTYTANAVVNKPDVTLKNVTITGNLIIGDGVADKEVILNNVTVTGKLIVRGGGENSIKIYGTSDISLIDIKQVNNKVSIKVSNDANVHMVYINDGSNDVTLYGPIGNVKVTGDNINVFTDGAKISNVVISGENSSFSVSEDTVVEKVSLDEAATNAQITVAGTVTQVSSDAANSGINVDGKGIVETITASKTAAGTKISVSNNAAVGSVTSDAKETVIKGDGKVEKAVINGDESKIETKETKVTVGEDTKGVEDKTKDSVTPVPTIIPTATPASSTGTGVGSNDTPGTVPTVAPTPTTEPVATSTPAPTPTVAPTDVTPTPVLNVIDDRFETGYPQIDVGTKSNYSTNLTLKLKLKDGVTSEESPITIYYIVSTSNTSYETSSESVIHGHLGKNYADENGTLHQFIYCTKTGAIKLTNTLEADIPLTIYSDSGNGMVVYFVIKSADKTSEVPTKIEFTGDTVSSFADTNPPTVIGTFWSHATTDGNGTEQRTVRIIVNEVLDSTTAVSGSAFAITGVSGASITAVTIHKQTENHYYPYPNWIDLNLQYPAGADLSNVSISYIKPETNGLSDIANIPNQMDNFTLYTILPDNSSYMKRYLLKDADPVIKNVDVSADGKYICLTLSPGITWADYKYLINGIEWKYKTMWISTDNNQIFLYNEAALQKEASYAIEITKTGNSKIYDVMDQEYNSVTATINDPKDSTVLVEGATYSMADKKLTITFNGNLNNSYELYYACQYVVTVDGVSYRLRGYADTEITDGKTNLVFDRDHLFDIDLSKITTSSDITVELTTLSTGYYARYDATESSGKPLDAFKKTVSVVE